MVATILNQATSKEVEKTLEGKQTQLKGLDKNPIDGFRYSVSTGSIKKR